jgi:hypothetical protein
VKPPHRTRSQSRISSLAAIARRIADDRALKAPGQPSCSVARVLAMPGGFPRPRFTMRVNTMMIAPIRVMTTVCVAVPGGEAGDRQRRPTRKLMNTEAAKYRTCCWSRPPVDVVTMVRKAGPRDARRRRSGPFYFLACSK